VSEPANVSANVPANDVPAAAAGGGAAPLPAAGGAATTAPPPAPPAAEPSVVAQRLTKVYGGKAAVEDLDLVVRPGEFFGFLGPNGAGKSTTIKMLCGLIRPTSGRAFVLGRDVALEPVAVKARIGVLPEEVNTYERLSAWELLLFTGRMHGLSRDASAERATDLLRIVEISEEDRHKMVVDYSMGMRKKTALACALIHAPRVLFLDEPFNGIDAVTSDVLRRIFQRLTESGTTIFFSSHVLEVVERLCTRLAIVHRGRLAACGTLDEIRAATGSAPATPLHDIFVRLVGGTADRGDVSWLK
jgi:ABC-2 type transport system ATP-binding protein